MKNTSDRRRQTRNVDHGEPCRRQQRRPLARRRRHRHLAPPVCNLLRGHRRKDADAGKIEQGRQYFNEVFRSDYLTIMYINGRRRLHCFTNVNKWQMCSVTMSLADICLGTIFPWMFPMVGGHKWHNYSWHSVQPVKQYTLVATFRKPFIKTCCESDIATLQCSRI